MIFDSINSRTSKKGIATIVVSFYTKGKDELSMLSEKLRQIESVFEIERTTADKYNETGVYMADLRIEEYNVGDIGTNCYFIVNADTKEMVIIDPGGDGADLIRRIKERGLNCRQYC